MQEGGRAPLDKYRIVPKPKAPVEDDEIRVSLQGRMSRLVVYAASLFKEKQKKRITIKATGSAIAGAITLAEILKRRFPNVHQHNIIGMTLSVDMYQPVEDGLDQVTYERNVPFIEIILALEESQVDTEAVGYQVPIDQSLVRPFNETTGGSMSSSTGPKGPRRNMYRGYRESGRHAVKNYNEGSVERSTQYSGGPRRSGFRRRGRSGYRGGGYRGSRQ